MLRYNMVVITRDNALKRAVKRVTTATGASATFIGDASGIDPKSGIHLAIFDARKENPDKLFFAKVPKAAKIIYIIAGDSLVSKITLLKDDRVTSLFCHDERFDEDEFIATATKCLREDVFGLQKYFPWGVTSFSMVLKNYEQKGRAIDVLMRYAKLAGVRGPVRDRIQLVADELIMNALYHAPVDDKGKEIYSGRSLKDLAKIEEVNQVQVQYGCSGRYFGISIRDGFGSLSRDRALEYLTRAKTGSRIEDKATGAGLGLISVLRSVSKLVFNLDPGNSTEVVGLFDMELFAKGKVGARSLHLHQEAPAAEEEEEDLADVNLRSGSNNGKWAFAAILLAVASAMGTAYYMQQGDGAAAAQSATTSVTVVPTPATAKVQFNGTDIAANQPFDWPKGASDRAQITAEAPGHAPQTITVDRPKPGSADRVYVVLPKRR